MIFYFIFLFIFGALIGSFLNVVILRLPDGKSIIHPRSRCSDCGHQIRWFENIPILSFVFLKGKCSSCKTKLSWQYPIIEIITGLAALYLMQDIVYGMESLVSGVFLFTVFCVFLSHFVIDLKHFLLLDSLNIYLGVVLLVYGIFYLPVMHMLIGALIGGGLPYLVTWLFYKLRGKIGLGGGDIKLWTVLGIYLGPIGVIHNIWLSCTLGAFVGVILIMCKIIQRDEPVPFGPFILIVASGQIFFQQHFSSYLSNILGF